MEKTCMSEVTLTGKVTKLAEKDHVCKEITFYRFYISVKRTSGAVDELPVVVSGNILNCLGLNVGDTVRVLGEYRSYSRQDETGKKLDLFVFARGLAKCSEEEATNNHVKMEGYVCKKAKLRVTAKGRRVVDIMVAVNKNGRSWYIPCILWNLTDETISDINPGNRIFLTGRVQSRQYHKKNGEEYETRTAYEVSVSHFALK